MHRRRFLSMLGTGAAATGATAGCVAPRGALAGQLARDVGLRTPSPGPLVDVSGGVRDAVTNSPDRLYLLAESSDGSGDAVHAVSTDGTHRWTATPPGATRPICASRETVYVPSVDEDERFPVPRTVTALDGATGETRWRTAIEGDVRNVVPIATVDGTVFVTERNDAGSLWPHPDQHVSALRERDGSTAWRAPCVDAVRGRLQGDTLFVEGFYSLVAYDAAWGDARWGVRFDAVDDAFLAVGETVVVPRLRPDDDRPASEPRLEGLAARSGEHHWTLIDDGSPVRPTALDGEPEARVAYAGDANGRLWELETASGRATWSLDLPSCAIHGLDAVDGRLFALNHGAVYAVDPGSNTWAWTERLSSGAKKRFWVVGETVYVESSRSDSSRTDQLRAFDARDGTERWTAETDDDGGWIRPAGDALLVGRGDGSVAAVTGAHPLPEA